MKTYTAPRQLLSQIDEILKQRPDPQRSPLQEVVDSLQHGRHYYFVGAFLRVQDFTDEQSYHRPPSGERTHMEELVVPIRIGVHELGAIQVQSERAISRQERILLEAVAKKLARFLSSNGRYLLRRLREAAKEHSEESAQSAKAN